MGQLFYSMGILTSEEYEECSASDLIAQFVGQSAPKTREALTRGLGKVLFIDEAYRLCDGEFGREAVNELVDSLTKPQFAGKLVVILAGYNDDINRLLRINPGLSSRFPEEVTFEPMKPLECLTLLKKELEKNDIVLDSGFQDTMSNTYQQLVDTLTELSNLPSWGSGRDVKTLAKSLTAAALGNSINDSDSRVTVTSEEALKETRSMLQNQQDRHKKPRETLLETLLNKSSKVQSQSFTQTPKPTNTNTDTAIKTIETIVEEKAKPIPSQTFKDIQRDPGVSDSVWNDFQTAIAASSAAERAAAAAIVQQEQALAKLRDDEEARRQEAENLAQELERAEREKKERAVLEELKRRREAERLRELAAKRAKEEAEARLKKAQEEVAKKRELERQAQKKLNEMGVCSAGYRWYRHGSGWRCRGGYHFVSDGQLGL
jgi:ATPase family protein associated with various cellular activities (AAA)